MYVCRLDCPWTDTPFALQGFLLQNQTQLEFLRLRCRHVWIDVERGRAPPDAALQTLERAPERMLHSTVHVNARAVQDEAPAARETLDQAARVTMRLIEQLRNGQLLASDDVQQAATSIVASVLRNADAMFWVNALRKRDAYAYSHAINCSMYAAAFGRHLGLPQDMLVELARGGLLFDIGKTRVSESTLAHPGPLSGVQMAEARSHVGHGNDILQESGESSILVRQMVASHHERFDGSGYPDALQGHSIPLYARIAAIIDSFDAMTSERAHAPNAMAHHEALQELYRLRDTHYHGELVEQFIGCLGVYPTGSLVELSSGEVAVVMAQNPSRRLRPQVMLLTREDKALRRPFEPLDLMQQIDETAHAVDILRTLPVGSYGLDPTELYL